MVETAITHMVKRLLCFPMALLLSFSLALSASSRAPANPYAGPDGTATMHGDSESSDTTPLPGPGSGPVSSNVRGFGGSCPTILIGRDSIPQALCTIIIGVHPEVFLLDPATGAATSQLALSSGGLLGGVYAYLDNKDRMVLVNADNKLIRIAHDRAAPPKLWIDSATDLGPAVKSGGGVVGVAPDYDGSVWFATKNGVVGFVAEDGSVSTAQLPAGESVANSISTAPIGMSVATTDALYLIDKENGRAGVRFRVPYDRGPGRKPGQLSWGTGSTPTFFGPETGHEYLAIVDNASPRVSLLVVRADNGSPVCSTQVLLKGGPGSENSPIGSGRSVFVGGTYGYSYPAPAVDPQTSVPPSAQFAGGMSRVDITPDKQCALVWDTDVRSAAVPKLSLPDNLIYTIIRKGSGNSISDSYWYGAINADTGAVVAEQQVAAGALSDTLQMAGTIAPGRIEYQGTITGIIRIAPR